MALRIKYYVVTVSESGKWHTTWLIVIVFDGDLCLAAIYTRFDANNNKRASE